MSRAVLITDGEQRSALAATRSLGRAGYTCYVTSGRSRPLAGASRYARDQACVRAASSDAAAFVDDVSELVRRWGVEILLPMADASILAVLEHRDRLPSVSVPFPDLSTYRRISDKADVARSARRAGISVPRQHVLETPSCVHAGLAGGLDFPIVVKPSRSVTRTADGFRSHTVRHVSEPTHLEEVVAGYPPEAYPLLLQERIVGPGVGVFLLKWEGNTVAAFAHRRLREKPPSGGVSVFRESTEVDPGLLEKSESLLALYDWRGVAMVEYKIESSSGTPYLMEVNGRFWGSLQLAVDAGVDFPPLLVQSAIGRAPEPVREYEAGVRTRWIWGDLDHLYLRLRDPETYAEYVQGRASRGRAVKEFLAAFAPGNRQEVLDPGDPGPFARETVDRLAFLFEPVRRWFGTALPSSGDAA